MATALCRGCGRRGDTRAMAPCTTCGSWLCAACAQHTGAHCPDCLHDLQDEGFTRLL